ncbi:nucleotide-binding domain-containing protein [Dichomitus squalens LYAD-421 SS1]|uniref:Nucleotide-binding domain-containing protein n=1 Tax=Dichomitus squalens (strain LYAD-421) TaxID=732165 RepID=R7SHX8_DICSQ|nr:nucleotide-binding domain-containing protein [Dichomitus squalens LYAD-421 SS1]EJF55756.1 nucleotide-binding domain-containing protein [Dichomitus squalens LYAD-421 SS1]
MKRVEQSPGVPVKNPTLSFWMVPLTPIPHDLSAGLPDYADVVVIGSGITGTSFAYTALAQDSALEIDVLCMNGGHVNPPSYHDYSELKEKHGEKDTRAMFAFRHAHLEELKRVALAEGILSESQYRETEHVDVFTSEDAFATAKADLAKWRADMPSQASHVNLHERDEAIQTFHLSDQVVGCISNSGGAIHPYRFVTSVLERLLARHPDRFKVYAHTPCTSISVANEGEDDVYMVHTSRGIIRTRHVVHATNGWSAHLLPGLIAKIVPTRAAMSTQRPGSLLHRTTLSGLRSFVFYRGGAGYDYLKQLPVGEHESMFGGGWTMAVDEAGVPDMGISEDSLVNHAGQSYLSGALPQYFGLDNWGADAQPQDVTIENAPKETQWFLGRTKAQWSGILGVSVDMLPWVGRLPNEVSGRSFPKQKRISATDKVTAGAKEAHTSAPGEWIAAGYTGDGMVHAWMSGKALAYMLLGKEDQISGWFPEMIRMTEKRWKKASIEELFAKPLTGSWSDENVIRLYATLLLLPPTATDLFVPCLMYVSYDC